MRVKVEQLATHLARSQAPIYVISGDEPLQARDALDQLIAAARGRDFTDRIVMHVDRGFDWTELAHHSDSLSLFAQRRILDLRMPGGKPGDKGARALTEYASRPNPDDLLILNTGRLESSALKSKWYRALEGAGVGVVIWPVEAAQLPQWIARRARALGVQLSRDAAELLAAYGEGNLLACDQEIQKILLARGPGKVDADEISASAADSARFDAFGLVDSALEGDQARTLRIAEGLRAEGVDPLPVLGALTWAIRSLATMAREYRGTASLDRIMPGGPVWMRRKRAVDTALKRHSWSVWLALLAQGAHVDRVVKGTQGNAWDELRRLALAVSGVKIFSVGPYNDGF